MQAELSKGGDSLLSKVMAAFARPTRLVSSQAVSPDAQVDAQLFEADEERQLQAAYHEVASKVDHYKLLTMIWLYLAITGYDSAALRTCEWHLGGVLGVLSANCRQPSSLRQ